MGNISLLQGITAGLGAGSSLMGGIGRFMQGRSERAAYDYNAAITLEETRKREEEATAKFRHLMGRQKSLYARAGVDIASGSPLITIAETAAREVDEEQAIREAGEEQYTLQKYYGKVAAWSGMMGGVSEFLTGLSRTGLALSSKSTSSTSTSSTDWLHFPY
jgi:hypothetical protein